MTSLAHTIPFSFNAPRGALMPSSLDTLHTFSEDLASIYYMVGQRYLETLQAAGKTDDPLDGDTKKTLQRLPFQLWALISAASKRAKRQIVFDALLEEKARGVDIPPSVVHHVGRVVLGRGFDEKIVMHLFAEKGRTAANKTETVVSDLLNVIEYIQRELEAMETAMQTVRAEQENAWLQSTQYERIYTAISPYVSRGEIAPQRFTKPIHGRNPEA